MNKIILFLFAITLFSCSNDDDTTENKPLLNSYHFANMFYVQPTLASATESNQVTLTYNNEGQIIKRLGGVRAIDPATGFYGAYSAEISDEVSYSNQTILIEEGRIVPFYPDPASRTKIVLDGNNKMLQRINLKEMPIYQTASDTVKFTYNTAGLISGSRKGKPNSDYEIAEYFYNTNKNLDSIVTQIYISGSYFYKVKETFSGYDTATNPLKKLFIFKETFLRSLSKNNFMHYQKNQYDFENTLVAHEERNWTISHDANGDIIF